MPCGYDDPVIGELLSRENELRKWLAHKGVLLDQIDDVIQETYARIISCATKKEICVPMAYARRTALSVIQQQFRRKQIASFEPLDNINADQHRDLSANLESDAQSRAILALIAQRLQALPQKTRSMFMLRRVDDLAVREVAALFEVSESTVEKSIRRTTAKLKTVYA